MKSNLVYLLFVSMTLLAGSVFSAVLSDQDVEQISPQELSMSRIQTFSVQVNDGITSVANLGMHYTQTTKRLQVSLRSTSEGALYISLNIVGTANPLNWSKIEADGSFQKRVSQDYGQSNQKLLIEYKGRVIGNQILIERMDLQTLDLSSVPMKILRSLDFQGKTLQLN